VSVAAVDAHPTFTVRRAATCLRGLHYVYAAPVAPDRLVAQLRAAFPHHLVEGEERWGDRIVRRLIVQFRFEVQIGTRAEEISFIHRVIANPEQRACDRARFESSLRAALAEELP
jgi:hypothetical protein